MSETTVSLKSKAMDDAARKASDRRERIATAVLGAIITRGPVSSNDLTEVCEYAVSAADALIAALKAVDPPVERTDGARRLAAAEPPAVRAGRVFPGMGESGG